MSKRPVTSASFFDRTWIIIAIFLALTFIIYGNSLRNEFAVIDDLQGYIQNETIRDIGKSIKSMNI
jgi:hypothetical protein